MFITARLRDVYNRERNVLFNDVLNTLHLRLYGVGHMVKDHSDSEKGERETFYLTTHSTHFIFGYMASDIWLNPTDSEKGNPLPPHRLLLSGRKETFYLTTHSTHFIYGYMASDIWLRTILIVRKETRCRHIGYSYQEGRKEMFYLTTHSTHFIYGYMASDIWLRTFLIVRKEPPLPPHRLLFPINSKGSFICTIPQTG